MIGKLTFKSKEKCPICLERMSSKDIEIISCGHKIHKQCLESLSHDKINSSIDICFAKKGKPWHKESDDVGSMLFSKQDFSFQCPICRKQYSCLNETAIKTNSKYTPMFGRVWLFDNEYGDCCHHITSKSDLIHYFNYKNWIRMRVKKFEDLDKLSVAILELFDNYMFGENSEDFHLVKCQCPNPTCNSVIPTPISLCFCQNPATPNARHASFKDLYNHMKNKD